MSARFATTRWSQVLAARDGADSQSRQALAALCEAYWYPLYAFVRYQGYEVEAAQDLTQAYFAELLEKDFLRAVGPEGGRFRSFLLASLKNFMSKQRTRARAKKRGGGQAPISIDAVSAEKRFAVEPIDQLTPDRVYERRWAMTVLGRSMDRLARKYVEKGKSDRFEGLRDFLTGQLPKRPYEEVAAELGISEATLRVAISRMRQEFGEYLRLEIAETVSDPSELDSELKYLLSVIGPWEPPQP